MKKLINTLSMLLLLAVVVGLASCAKDDDVSAKDVDLIEETVLQQIAQLGFSTEKVIRHEDGYIVEGDIYLSRKELQSVPTSVRVPDVEQYHTFNLVTSTPRTINVYIRLNERGRNKRLNLPSSYGAALDNALGRYNAENLTITFQRVTSSNNADIILENTSGQFLASAGFPTSGGDPHNLIRVNASAIGDGGSNSTFQNYLATILAHEIGHCIGFRHTDWFDRSISCGSGGNEGQETTGVGAVHIPGTPTGASLAAQSFMLSCIGSNQNRPFNADDQVALDYLY